MSGRIHYISLALFISCAVPNAVLAFDGTLESTSIKSSRAQVLQENNRSLITTFSSWYDLAFQKILDEKHPYLSLYYRDFSTNASSVYQMTEAERTAEARLVVRQALYTALKDTVNNVNLLYSMKEYGRAMTSADMKVRNGTADFEGPSLSRAGNHEDPSPQESFRSSLMLINNADFGLSFRTSFGPFQSDVTYFLAGHDILGASLSKELFKQASLVLDYRMASDENRALLRLNLPFRY